MMRALTIQELQFWDAWPQLLPLYETLAERIDEICPDVRVKVSKTQISFYSKYLFAAASPPPHRRSTWPKEFLLVTLGMGRPLENERVAVCVEPCPGRFTCHVLVQRPQEIDDQLLSWIREAYDFSLTKGRRRR